MDSKLMRKRINQHTSDLGNFHCAPPSHSSLGSSRKRLWPLVSCPIAESRAPESEPYLTIAQGLVQLPSGRCRPMHLMTIGPRLVTTWILLRLASTKGVTIDAGYMSLITLFLDTKSFENFNGGSSSRGIANREIEWNRYLVWLEYS